MVEVDPGDNLAQQLLDAAPDVVFQRAARDAGARWLRPGPARIAAHALHPFGRAGLGARHAQAAHQGRLPRPPACRW
ncbi:MAG: hypothetical protein WDM81_12730 [Rhizomicrobium sp.]